MSSYRDNDITILVTKNKECTNTLKDLHYRINDVIYPIQYQHLLPTTTKRVINTLTDIRRDLLSYEPKKNERKKYEELYNQLQDRIWSLQTIKDEDYQDLTANALAILRYRISVYLDDRKNKKYYYVDAIIKALEVNKNIYDDCKDYTKGNDELYRFIKMQDELFSMFNEKYRL